MIASNRSHIFEMVAIAYPLNDFTEFLFSVNENARIHGVNKPKRKLVINVWNNVQLFKLELESEV